MKLPLTDPLVSLGGVLAVLLCLAPKTAVAEEVWQWSVEMPATSVPATYFGAPAAPAAAAADVAKPMAPPSRAFLWVPPECKRVRAVVLAQNNMTETDILEHPAFRKTLAELGIAEVWVCPPFDGVFHFEQGAGERVEALLKSLAVVSGYGEMAMAPVIPLGHSACASYPWNFAAWNPGRTLAVLSVHGDAPLTNMTGSGHPNPDWGDRNIDGVPGLMVMGEYEYVEGRLTPGIAFREKHPMSPVAFLAEPGRGHFDISDTLIDFLSMFLRKAVAARLPAEEPGPADRLPALKAVDPTQGWLVDRWHFNGSPSRVAKPAPFLEYVGYLHDVNDTREGFWAFDREMAEATQDYRAAQENKKPQLIGFVENGQVVHPAKGDVTLHFIPMNDDGISFRLAATFLDAVTDLPNHTRWARQPVGTPLGHASGGGPILFTRITGPIAQTGADTFAIHLDRLSSTMDRRKTDIWLYASHPGDGEYKSMVQQAMMRLAPNTVGAEQHLTFAPIPDQRAGVGVGAADLKPLKLTATSDAGMPVYYYVREGPAEIEGHGEGAVLKFTAIPVRAKFPLAVTVVAWQWGRGSGGVRRSRR